MSRKLKEKIDALLAVERGTVYKARGTDVEIALAYPNTYHVGMSNLGIHQIYAILTVAQTRHASGFSCPTKKTSMSISRPARNCSALRASGR